MAFNDKDNQRMGKHASHAAGSDMPSSEDANSSRRGNRAVNIPRGQQVQSRGERDYLQSQASPYQRGPQGAQGAQNGTQRMPQNGPQRMPQSGANQYSRNASQYSRNAATAQYSASNYTARKKHSKAPFIVVGVLAVLLVVVGVCGFFAYGSAKTLKADANTVMTDVSTLKEAVTSGDYSGAAEVASDMQATAKEMNSEMHSPLWTVASVIPVVGSDVSSLQTWTDVFENLCGDLLIPLTDNLQGLGTEGLVRDDGSINVQTVDALLSVVEDAAPTMQTSADCIEALPDMNISQLQDTIGPVKEQFLSANELYQQAAELAPVASKMLGSEGDRHYLIAAQNTDEMRSSGGFPGSIGLLTVSNGNISLSDFGTPYDLMETTVANGVTDEEASLFAYADPSIGVTTPRDAGSIPDFTRVADLWSQAYTAKTGNAIDGVVSLTPAVVQDLLAISGGITLSDGTTLDGTNATKVLEHDLYWKYLSTANRTSYSDDVSDALFSEAAGLAFKKVLGGMNASSVMDMVQVFTDDMANHTFMLWLTNADEQNTLSSLNCSGALKTGEENPEIGVFIGGVQPSKIGWYMDCDTSVGEGTKNADGSTSYEVTITLHNAFDAADYEAAGHYIAGQQDGAIWTAFYLTAPEGGSISNLQSSDNYAFTESSYEGLQLFGASSITIQPGASSTITYTVTTSANAEEDLKIHQTPVLTQYR